MSEHTEQRLTQLEQQVAQLQAKLEQVEASITGLIESLDGTDNDIVTIVEAIRQQARAVSSI
jgi:cell division protein FtsB